MLEFFDTSLFPPRWHCGTWSPTLGWMTILSDVTIFLAYTAIPITIAIYMHRRKDILFPHLFWIFLAFIAACGATHLIEAIIFWYPIYPVQAVLKVFTAIVSVAAVIATAVIMPQALSIPGMKALNLQLQEGVAAHEQAKRELTDRTVELLRSEKRLLAAQQAASIGDWSYLPQSETIIWSDQVYQIFNRDKNLGPPKNFEENIKLYTKQGAETLSRAMAEIEAGAARKQCDLEVRLPNGSIAWHQSILHAERNTEGVITKLWGTAQDITESKLDALQKERQQQELRRINEQLEQFAYIASHDLVEPLRKVCFFHDIVAEETAGKLSEEGQDAMDRMAAANERMKRLINDLLTFARSGKSLTTVVSVSLNEVVKEALDNCDAEINKLQAEVSVPELPQVDGDHVLLVQVFQNILLNALRYRDEQRRPAVTITSETNNEYIKVSIRDNGKGFDKEQASRLFEPFVRLNAKKGDGGTGMGLAICRRIIEAHNGRIEANPLQIGAEFVISFPKVKDQFHGT